MSESGGKRERQILRRRVQGGSDDTEVCLRCGKRKCVHLRTKRTITNEKDTKPIILHSGQHQQVQQQHPIIARDGQYHEQQQHPLNLHIPWSELTSLCNRLVTWINATHTSHQWTGLVPLHLGQARAVDTAALALCEAQQHFILSDPSLISPIALERSFKIYGLALRHLQALLSDSKTATSDAALVSVALLSTFENYMVHRRRERGDSRTHWAGIQAILAARPKFEKAEEVSQITRAVIYDFHDASYVVPSAMGIASPFEVFCNLEPPNRDGMAAEAKTLQRVRHELSIMAPRLSMYIQALRRLNPGEERTDVEEKGKTLAKRLLDLEDEKAESEFLHRVKLVPNQDKEGHDVVKYMMNFDSFAEERVGLLYWAFYLVIINLTIELASIIPHGSEVFDLKRLGQQQDRLVANIIMCWQYSAGGGLLRTVELHHPYLVVWGSLRNKKEWRGKPVEAVRQWLLPRIHHRSIEWTMHMTPALVDAMAYGLMGGGFQTIKTTLEEADWEVEGPGGRRKRGEGEGIKIQEEEDDDDD